jgi:hypothetical protein
LIPDCGENIRTARACRLRDYTLARDRRHVNDL